MMAMTWNDLFKFTFAKYAAIAVLPLAVLLSRPAINCAVLAFGERALLETMPVDPRDFLRGDYVTLDYEISRIPDGIFQAEEPFSLWKNERDRHFFVILKIDAAGVATVAGASAERPREGIYLKGRFSWNSLVDYGLGAYYVPEGTGGYIEDKIRDSRVFADVRILRGRAVIKNLRFEEESAIE
jgi:uncharacterized membrane-anchored protein